ncbi:putative gluconolactonase precursor [Periconia macrospinosa]|uniref:Putative gluconolactonase n=1 Tax=Periconia macrospinosa TaxID=97972 RepID=A0A2V1D5G0_9PLEO|nr:putative gluconolactonase precursor [Periconia macrospinosa]
MPDPRGGIPKMVIASLQRTILLRIGTSSECVIPGAICLDNHAARLPYPFYRDPYNGSFFNALGDTEVPSDKSWSLVADADFVIFDEKRGREILGEYPSVEYVFEVGPYLHESPVFVPGLNKIFFSELSPTTEQFVVDLNATPPTLSRFTADPPIYVPNGAFFHEGKVWYSTAGSNASVAGGPEQRPGLVTLDPYTLKTTTILDNYFGYAFSDCDDIIVDPVTGYVWFTVPYYSWWLEVSDIAPQLRSATYRFDPKTGSTVVVNDEMRSPNGIALSPDRRHLYISDTGAAGLSAPISLDVPSPGIQGILYNTTGKRTIYKFDLVDDGRAIVNKRPIHYDAIGTVPDGLKVARNGYIVTATGNGLSVLDQYGDMILRVQTNFTANNFIWTDVDDYREVWIVGQGGVARVKWNLQGQRAQ